MTQTINLESDVYAVAESLARQEHCTVGAVVDQVLRQTLVVSVPSDSQPSERTPSHLTIDPDTGLPAVKCSQTFVSEDVYRSELDIDDVALRWQCARRSRIFVVTVTQPVVTWDRRTEEPFNLPVDKRLTVAAYSAGREVVADIEPPLDSVLLPVHDWTRRRCA